MWFDWYNLQNKSRVPLLSFRSHVRFPSVKKQAQTSSVWSWPWHTLRFPHCCISWESKRSITYLQTAVNWKVNIRKAGPRMELGWLTDWTVHLLLPVFSYLSKTGPWNRWKSRRRRRRCNFSQSVKQRGEKGSDRGKVWGVDGAFHRKKVNHLRDLRGFAEQWAEEEVMLLLLLLQVHWLIASSSPLNDIKRLRN